MPINLNKAADALPSLLSNIDIGYDAYSYNYRSIPITGEVEEPNAEINKDDTPPTSKIYSIYAVGDAHVADAKDKFFHRVTDQDSKDAFGIFDKNDKNDFNIKVNLSFRGEDAQTNLEKFKTKYSGSIVIEEVKVEVKNQKLTQEQKDELLKNHKQVTFILTRENSAELFPEFNNNEDTKNKDLNNSSSTLDDTLNKVANKVFGINTRRGQGSEVNVNSDKDAVNNNRNSSEQKESGPNVFQRFGNWLKEIPSKISYGLKNFYNNIMGSYAARQDPNDLKDFGPIAERWRRVEGSLSNFELISKEPSKEVKPAQNEKPRFSSMTSAASHILEKDEQQQELKNENGSEQTSVSKLTL